MSRFLRRRLSATVGWLADRRIPGPLRGPVYRLYARATGADPGEARLALPAYPSLGAFFVRQLAEGARPLDPDETRLIAPCDGLLQAQDSVREGTLLQAKGSAYTIGDLLAGVGDDRSLEGATAWTIYLSPRDYHRVHAPLAARLGAVRWVPGDRRSVAPQVVAARPRVFATNERAVLRLETDAGPYFVVMVGALNVGRIRVVGVTPGAAPDPDRPLRFERGDELARFEMGSTVVLVLPPGRATPLAAPRVGDRVRLGQALGELR